MSECRVCLKSPISTYFAQVILGGMMMDWDFCRSVLKQTTHEFFMRSLEHYVVYLGIKAMAENHDPVDWITVGHWVTQNRAKWGVTIDVLFVSDLVSKLDERLLEFSILRTAFLSGLVAVDAAPIREKF